VTIGAKKRSPDLEVEHPAVAGRFISSSG
jgi:hypothetical protein